MNITHLDKFHIADIKNIQHPSIFYGDENYDLFILRLPFLNKGKLDFESNSFIITKESYYFYNKINDEIENLEDIKEFYKVLNKKINIAMKIVNDYFSTVSDLEETLYKQNKTKNFNSIWFSQKNDLIRINRVLYKALDTIEDIINEYKHEDDFLNRNFADIHEHINRAYRNSGHALEKLDTIYSFYQTQINEQMNRIVYVLTLLSGIFLPLNFIVGFFGMNTTSLPFTEELGGTFIVVSILIITALLSTLITLIMRKRA